MNPEGEINLEEKSIVTLGDHFPREIISSLEEIGYIEDSYTEMCKIINNESFIYFQCDVNLRISVWIEIRSYITGIIFRKVTTSKIIISILEKIQDSLDIIFLTEKTLNINHCFYEDGKGDFLTNYADEYKKERTLVISFTDDGPLIHSLVR